MFKIKYVISLGIILASSNAHTKECAIYYDGINPVDQPAPSIQAVHEREVYRESADERLRQIEEIGELGIERYIKSAIAGTVKDSLTVGNQQFNLLDLALLKGASQQTVSKLFNMGYSLSTHAIPMLQPTYMGKEFIDIIYTNSSTGLESILINQGERRLSLVNYLLINRDFATIRYLSNEYGTDVNSNISYGDMVDIRTFSFEDRMKASSLIDVNNYTETLTSKREVKRKKESDKEIFNEEFHIYSLKHNCKSSDELDYTNVKYAVKHSDIKDKINQLGIDLDTATLSDLQESMLNPVVEEYLGTKIYRAKLSKGKRRKAKTIKDDYRNLTDTRIEELLSNRDVFYINQSGLTLREFLFLNRKLDWNQYAIEMSMKRIASYLASDESELLSYIGTNQIKELSSNFENGKNLVYYLLKYAKTKRALNAIKDQLPKPESEYGLNPAEMLLIKSELTPLLSNSIREISLAVKKEYEVRL